jgi:DNA-binding HxlR family transcriptional regulator
MKPLCAPCNIEKALEIIGDKWTALILNELSGQPCAFSELEKSVEGISPRTLSQRLDKLEQEKILEKVLYCERPPRYNYALTAKGKELKTVITKMATWGARHT